MRKIRRGANRYIIVHIPSGEEVPLLLLETTHNLSPLGFLYLINQLNYHYHDNKI